MSQNIPQNGVLAGRIAERVTLRVQALEPYSSELTTEQVAVIADIAEKYGSGNVHITPRQTIELPDIEAAYLTEILEELSNSGLYPGSTGEYIRNITACSRWCLYNAQPVSELAQRLNKHYLNKQLPGKTDISLSGCDFSCTRSRTSDIGVIVRSEVELTDNKCIKCQLCVKAPLGCQVDAIKLDDGEVSIDMDLCIRCGFCSTVCKPSTIQVRRISYDIYIGGKGGVRPREAVLYNTWGTEQEVTSEIHRLIEKYCAIANAGERIGDVIERLGIEVFQ